MPAKGYKPIVVAVTVYLSEREYNSLLATAAKTDQGTFSEVIRDLAYMKPIPYGYSNGYINEEEYRSKKEKS